MSKIQMDPLVYGKLKEALGNMLQMRDGAAADGTAMEDLQSAQNLCRFLADDMYRLADLAGAMDAAVYDRDLTAAVHTLAEVVDRLQVLREDVDTLHGYVLGAAAAINDATEPMQFASLVTDEELKCLIDEQFEEESVMSVGYQDGQYALFFGEGENERGPYIFAVGREEDEEAVRAYIERFLDMEDEE